MFNFSIIIPHFESVHTLRNLLNSIPEKKDIQIIVVDDNSKFQRDDLYCLIKETKRNNLLFLKNKGNKGAGGCRNTGLKKASGKWVLFADSDDFFLDGFYDCICNFLHEESDIVYFSPTSIEIDSFKESDRHLKYENMLLDYIKTRSKVNELRLKYGYIVPWSKLIKRKLIEDNDISFDEVLASNDVMFSTKVAHKSSNFSVSLKQIYCVTERYGSLTTSTSYENFKSRLDVFVRQYKYLEKILPSKQFKYLDLSGSSILITAYIYKIPKIKILKTVFYLKRNNIKIMKLKFLNPFFMIMKFVNLISDFNYKSKFFSN